ncbi:hypothetical protein GYMLUDRAFT_153644 [Collybiopsis luxurians FD-317 M1]|nr:hypothetical protein GYMLUDRAFT_153644 [Collybiopsis luxurians FD-317 M1]
MADCKILIIGAGLAGLGMAVQLKRLLKEDDFELFEKFDDVGGTWAQNTYPNLSCDIPSEFYSYSFFQNADWTSKFASQPEILAYIHRCVQHYDLEDRIRLQQECTSLRWSEKDCLWTASFIDLVLGRKYERKARYVITALGVLNVPKGLDDLPVLRAFKGTIFHTAEWREVDFQNKNVMVIGNGCSANQIIPWILNERSPKSLVQIVRSEQWVAPKGDFEHGTAFRWLVNLSSNFRVFRTDRSGTKAREAVSNALRSYMKSVSAPRYHPILIPQYDFGAKRGILDHGYLEVTNRENFTLVKCDGLRAVEDDGRTVVDSLGNRYAVDIVIMANGFKTQDLLTPMTIYGNNGQELRQLWRTAGGAQAYMGVSAYGFPNLFMLTGPNTLPSGNSTLHGIECSIVYITRLLKHLRRYERTKRVSIMPKENAEREFNEKIQEQLQSLVYTNAVSAWYINPDTGKNTLIWPGSQTSFWWSRCIKWIRWKDWTIE